MPRFSYIAHDINGEKKTGTVKAPDRPSATARLRNRGLFPSEVSGTDLQLPTPGKQPSRGIDLNRAIPLPAVWSPVRPRQLMIFTRQMATLIHAGLPPDPRP